jgi:uncharacterized protein YndB with AHSA1/START domain
VPSVHRTTPAAPAAVWAVLADGWSLAGWVVGSSRIREVDAGWPAAGTRAHHSVGAWPLLLDDSTSVVSAVPERELVLQARGWPAGEARVTLRLRREGGGTRLDMTEVVTHGPGRLVPGPLQALAVAPRNAECLRRLVLLVEGRSR